MAKLLGQDIVTHEEFEQFKDGDFKLHEVELIILKDQIQFLSTLKASLESRIRNLAAIATFSALVSLATTIFVLYTK